MFGYIVLASFWLVLAVTLVEGFCEGAIEPAATIAASAAS